VAGVVEGMIFSIPAVLLVVLAAAVARFLRPRSRAALIVMVVSAMVLVLFVAVQVLAFLPLWSLQTQAQSGLD